MTDIWDFGRESEWRKVPGRYRKMYRTTLACGLLAHAFALTNILQNHDNMNSLPDGYGTGIESGRWLLELIADVFPQFWGGSQNNSWFNGIVTLLVLSLSACVIAAVFRIGQRPEGCLWGAVFICFPTVTSSFFYIFTAPLYSFSVLMAVCAVYVTARYRKGWIAGMVLSALSMGIYQAFFPLTASLLVISVIWYVLGDEEDIRQLWMRGIRCVLMLVGALVIYLVVLKVSIAVLGTELYSYRGINQIGTFRGFHETWEIIKAEYKNFFLLPFQNYMGITCTWAIRIMLMIILVIAIVSLAWAWLFACDRGRKVLLAFCLACFPFTVNAILLMCPDTEVYTLMEYAISAVFLLPLALLHRIWILYEKQHTPAQAEADGGTDRPQDISAETAGTEATEVKAADRMAGTKREQKRGHRGLVRGAALVLAGAYVILTLNYAWVDTINYTAAYYTSEQTLSFFTTLVTQVKETEGYRTGLPWAFIGTHIKDDNFANGWGVSLGGMRLGGNAMRLINKYSRNNFIRFYTGYIVHYATSEQIQELRAMDEVVNMPRYPADGSIQIINDVIVIRINDELETNQVF